MKRKNVEEEDTEKKQKEDVSKEQLAQIVKLIDREDFEGAIELIPANARHLPLMMDWGGYDSPLLVYAASRGCRNIVKYLLNGGANIEWTEPEVRII